MKQNYCKLLSVCLFLATALFSTAQNVGINDDNSTPDANAMLDVNSSTKGALFPRMTTAQRTTLGNLNPTEGMLVFDTDVAAYFYFVDGDWTQLATGATAGVPAGTILAFGGENVPDGYLACDGSVVSNLDYPDLFTAIGTSWGGVGTPNFNLPDLRGRFPRGWNNGAGNDPDVNSRYALHNGGVEDDHVGSYQDDAFENHTHTYNNKSGYINRGSSGGQAAVWYQDRTANTGGASNGPSSETRPRNAYVHYIIKY